MWTFFWDNAHAYNIYNIKYSNHTLLSYLFLLELF